MFQGEVYGEDVKVLGLSYGGTLNFDGQARRVGPITHSGVWEEVVIYEHSNAARMGSG